MRLINELRRRNVFRVAAAYLVVAWLVLQVGDVAADGLFLPDWFMPMLFVMLGLGLPIALVLSWAFEWTPEGIMRDADVSRPAGVLPASARSLDRLIVVALIAVIAVLAVERIWFAGKESRRAADFRDKSVAVLPFSNFSDDPANAYFADGIAEEILNLLAAVRELEVASRTSSFAFRDAETPLPRIADALEVRYLLEGSVRRAGDRVRITAQLIDAATDRHLWSRTFDRELDDIFAVQDEIAGAVGAALQVELLGRGGRLVSAQVVDPGAYERFLEARFLMRQRNAEALSRAEGMLESVVAAEPDFARALSLLAEVLVLKAAGEGAAGDMDRERIGRLADKALALDPELGSAYLIRGQLRWQAHDTVGAVRDMQQAISLSPDEPRPYHWLAYFLGSAGYLDRSMASIAEAIRLEPDNANAHGWRAALLSARGSDVQALEAARRQASLGNPMGHMLAFSFLLAGDPAAAERDLDAAIAGGLARAERLRFLLEAARGSALDGAQLEARLAGDETLLAHQAAAALLALGQHEPLLARLESFEGSTWATLPPVVWRPDYAMFRADSRFVEHLGQIGITRLWAADGPPTDCRRTGAGYHCGLRTSLPVQETDT